MPYRTTIQLEVLHQDPIPDGMDLAEIYRETISGDYSGAWTQDTDLITDKECKAKLLEHGTDPYFFGYDDDEEGEEGDEAK
jgi:hypothetical protein